MINPLYFDRSAISQNSSGDEMTKIIDSHRDSFVRFCVKEWSIENYIALMCCAAFPKNPTWKRLQTFYVVFLKGTESPLEINVSGKDRATIANVVTVGPVARRGAFGRTTFANPTPRLLDGLVAPLKLNLGDTYSRYRLAALDPEARYTSNRVGRFFGQYSDGMKALKKTTSSDQNAVTGLGILESGGWPVRHMGLTGVVSGF